MTNPTEYEWLVPLWMGNDSFEDILVAVNAALRAAGRRPWAASTLASVANRLRKAGVRLPKRAYREKLADRTPGVARLNALIDGFAAGETPPVPGPPPAPPRPAPAVDPREAVRKILEEMRQERKAD